MPTLIKEKLHNSINTKLKMKKNEGKTLRGKMVEE